MDELMAAMVLSSLSCSPLLHSPVQPDATGKQQTATEYNNNTKESATTSNTHTSRCLLVFSAPLMDCGSNELSDSASSGYWSVGHAPGSPTPSPPLPDSDSGPATPPDEGLDMELEHVLFDEPAPRKRRVSSFFFDGGHRGTETWARRDECFLLQNSAKVAFRCLWPSCGKELTTVVGIKRHIRTTHLW